MSRQPSKPRGKPRSPDPVAGGQTPPVPNPARAGPPAPNEKTPTANRWQRRVRYGWDKGGSRGGRR